MRNARKLPLLLAAALAGPALAEGPAHFKGESCTRCHESIRDAAAPPPAIETALPKRKIVIVGGGIAGLSAAHFLRDLDPLVLEKEEVPGGHARRESFSNGPYPVAAVYLDKPEGVVKQLMDELKLEPSPIKLPAETIRYGKRTINEFLSDGAPEFPAEVRPELLKLAAALKELSKKKLVIPVSGSDPELLAKYEGITFWDYMEKGFGPTSASLGDMFAKDMFGAGAKDISAFMGLLYIMDMITPSGYSWPGGLGAVSEALAKELGTKVQTGCMVVWARQSPEGVELVYRKDGALHAVEADAVIFATHMLVTSRIAQDLSAEKRAAAAKMKYSSYVTVPLSFREKVWDRSYTLWSADSVFTDVTFDAQNNSRFPGTDEMPGQVAVAYVPMGDAGHAGRYELLRTSDDEILRRVKADLEKVLPGSVEKLQEARVVRWGHAMPVMGPNYHRDVRPVLARPQGRYFFAGEDTEVPALEGAVYSGYYAARDARAFLGRRAAADPR